MEKKSRSQNKKTASPKKVSEQSASKADKKDFLVVGLGASAGGVRALQEFFATMPPDSGMAFVVILHLSPEHESNLPKILQTQTSMKVTQVAETVKVEPNNVYVIPPNRQLEMVDGVIRPAAADRPRGHRIAIDVFFRTLAEAYERNAVCIVLSGTGSDGTLGLKRVKESNGFAIVQEPDDAEYDSMPRSAINTQLADWVLPVHQMPEKLIHFRESSERLHLTNGADPKKVGEELHADDSLREILTLLRVRTGHDFSNYKTPTLIRRIARHLQIHELEDIPAYLELLRSNPNEIHSLLKNLLINVTNFFRDKNSFESLEKEIVPNLFAGKTGKDTVRIWSCGCASGEEAYSLAMLVAEYSDRLPDPPKIQIFASDVDDEAIAEAREHRYPESIEADVSSERLKRFFLKEGSFYRVRKELRELVLFAPHNVLRDPPFSRLDLVSCRNLLIYLNRETQERVLQIFHFALNSSGYLFLGSSETAENVATLYSPVNKKHRIYARRNASAATSLPMMPIVGRWEVRMPDDKKNNPARDRTATFSEIHYKLLENYAPSSVLVNQDFDIVYLSGTANKFLRFSGGEPSRNLLKAVVPDLLPDLRAALFSAQREHKSSEFPNIRLRIGGEETTINLVVRAVDLQNEASDFLLVIFEERNFPTPQKEAKGEPKNFTEKDEAMETIVRRLEEDLQRTKEHLRFTIEQHETTVEELKASNEELQAINEELRSASEELETSKEELQSVNEELTTVNHELKDKIDETSRVNSDLSNLMAATDIATIFLDKQLRIKRYTPPVEYIFNITPADIGRPLEHFTHRLNYSALSIDAGKALRSLVTIEREISDDKNRVYLSRFLPYRTIDDRIDGVVLNFIDITERKKSEIALRESEIKLQFALSAAQMGTFVWHVEEDRSEPDEQMLALFGQPKNGTLNLKNVLQKIIHPDDRDRYAEAVARAVDPRGDGALYEEVRVVYPDKSVHWRAVTARTFFAEEPRRAAQMYGTAIDITGRKQAEEALRQSEARQSFLVRLGDAVRPLSGAVEITETIVETALTYFRSDRCYYGEVAGDVVTIRRDARSADLPTVAGVYSLNEIPLFKSVSQSGQPIVVRDVAASDVMDDSLKALCLSLGILSYINVPVIKGRRLVGFFCLTQSAARDWTDIEIEVAKETAERTWAAVERARTEEALRASEELFRLVSDAVPAVIYDWNVPEDEITRSGELKNLLGFSPDDRRTQTNEWWKTRLHPDDAEIAAGKVVEKLASNDYRFEDEYRLKHRDGHYVWVSDTGVMLRDETGAVVRWIGSVTNITERREAEKAVRQSEEKFRLFVTAASEIVYVMNADWSAMLRLEGKSFLADTRDSNAVWLEQYIPDEDRAATEKAIAEAVRTKTTFELEHRVIRADGSIGWVFSRAIPLMSEQGEIIEWFGTASNITLRKEAEEALAASEDHCRALVNQNIAGIFEIDLDGIVFFANDEFCRMLGYECGKAPRIPMTDFIYPEDLSASLQKLERMRKDKKPFEMEKRFVRKDGSLIWVHNSISPITNGDEEIHSAVVVSLDISKRKQTELHLREAEERTRITLEAAELATWEWNLETNEVFWNDQHFRLFGMKPRKQPLVPDDFFRHVHPDHRDYIAAELKKAVERRVPFDVEFCAVLTGGETRWMSGYGRVTEIDAGGATTRMSGVMFDITERKTIAETLRKSEEQLQLILESTRDYAIVTFDLQGTITRWNKGAEAIFGYAESEALGRSGDFLFTPEDQARGVPEQEMKTALEKGRAEDERWHMRKDGSRFFASGVMQPLQDGTTEGFVKIARDQTERLEAESALREKEMLQKLVAAQEEERKRIARDLHDELGQQLTALRIKLDAIRKSAGEPALLNKLNEIREIARSIDEGVDFLAFELRPSVLDDFGLIAALDNYVKQWSHYSGVKGDLVVSNFKKTRFKPEVENCLYRIVQESLNNVHKHSRATHVEVVCEIRRDQLILIVEDNGKGFNLKNALKTQMGIGLLGMQERALLVGGTLEIETAPKKGTTIYVRISVSDAKMQ